MNTNDKMAESAGIVALPNEILISVLSYSLTKDLLPITPTCHLFHDLIVRIIQNRLHEAASHEDHKLVLECYHPSAKFYTPYLYCTYLNTPGLDIDARNDITIGSLGRLSKLYSYFRPLKPEEGRRAVLPHPAGGWPALPPIGLVDKHEEFVCQDIHLDSHELFYQLVTVTNLVRPGPKLGVFKSSVNIGDGLTRVWRDWLAECVCCEANEAGNNDQEKRLLWSDPKSHVGIRMHVRDRPEVPVPVMRRDEDPPVSYTLQYEGLAIRTSQLLLKMEKSFYQDINRSGKGAVVIGPWIR